MNHAFSQKSQLFILMTIFLDVLGIGLIIPVLPALIGTLTHSQAEQAHWYGWLASTFGIMQFLCMPLLGALSDRYGRRPILLLSTFGLGLSYLVTAFSHSLAILLVARLVSGSTSATMSVANAYLADTLPRPNNVPKPLARQVRLLVLASCLGRCLAVHWGQWICACRLLLPPL